MRIKRTNTSIVKTAKKLRKKPKKIEDSKVYMDDLKKAYDDLLEFLRGLGLDQTVFKSLKHGGVGALNQLFGTVWDKLNEEQLSSTSQNSENFKNFLQKLDTLQDALHLVSEVYNGKYGYNINIRTRNKSNIKTYGTISLEDLRNTKGLQWQRTGSQIFKITKTFMDTYGENAETISTDKMISDVFKRTVADKAGLLKDANLGWIRQWHVQQQITGEVKKEFENKSGTLGPDVLGNETTLGAQVKVFKSGGKLQITSFFNLLVSSQSMLLDTKKLNQYKTDYELAQSIIDQIASKQIEPIIIPAITAGII